MNFKLPISLAILSTLGMGAALADGGAPEPDGVTLAALEDFVGTWVLADENGDPTEQIATTVRKTAGGSAMIETLFPGAPEEMITMYYEVDGKLQLTHYCACTSHPILAGSRDEEGNLRFDCIGKGENFAECTTTTHMHDAVYRFDGKDKVTTAWRLMEGGEAGEVFEFTFIRQPVAEEAEQVETAVR